MADQKRGGWTLSKETRDKISMSLMGNKRRLGTKHSAETRRKMSLSSLGVKKSPQHRANISKAKTGVPTGFVPRTAFKKGRIPTKEQIRACLKKRPMSGLETRVKRVIDEYRLPYKFVGNGGFFIGRKNPDFINTNEKKAVEVYWNRHKQQFAKGGLEGWKNERVRVFERYGWQPLFLEGTGLTKEKIVNVLKGG